MSRSFILYRMSKYLRPIVYAFFFFVLFGGDIILYYTRAKGHSPVPYIIGGVIAIGFVSIFTMAEIETFKHRHDKEPW